MTKSLLKQIQSTVMKYAEAIASIVGVEVEIIDKNFIRIASTDIYKDGINENMLNEGFVYQYVLSTGQYQVIENPGEHKLCENCINRHCCVEKLELCTPIKFKDDIIGVIGLICLEEKQREYILNNLDSHLKFLHQIAYFISVKVSEHMEKKKNNSLIVLLKKVINSINKGVLIIDSEERIVEMNNSAITQLKLDKSCINERIQIKSNEEYIMGGESLQIKIFKNTHYVIGQTILVSHIIPNYEKILIFDKINKLKKVVYEASNLDYNVAGKEIIGKSKQIIDIKRNIKKISTSSSTVLITGESGTGKELIARAIHKQGDRKDNPFVAINCGAIPDTLLESELFGYVRGAFSGADPKGKIGKFELANDGIIFLDEIGDMPLHLQVKILRVLQERKIIRIGSNKPIDLDVRVIAATNKDLMKLIIEKKFREDLFYRLNVIPIKIPPLRERREDIEILGMKMIEKYNKLFNKKVQGIEEKAIEILKRHPWYGNVRELENVIECMINFADDSGMLTVNMIPKTVLEHNEVKYEKNIEIGDLKTSEYEYILKALDIYGYDTKGKKKAAEKLGIGIATLYRKLKENGKDKVIRY